MVLVVVVRRVGAGVCFICVLCTVALIPLDIYAEKYLEKMKAENKDADADDDADEDAEENA